MRDIFYSIFAGVLQGLTEFLPISSSGHLVIFHDVFGFNFIDNVAFDVVLHIGTLLALLLFFWPDVLRYLKALVTPIQGNSDQRLAWYLIVATVPAVVTGFLFETMIETVFRSTTLVAVMLITFGLALYFVDRFATRNREITELSFGGALLIGCAQALALVPGVSRSGITIIAGLSQKLNREAAARFSFLLSIPVVAGAGTKKIVDLVTQNALGSVDYTILFIGFLVSAVTGYLCIKYFLKFLQRNSLAVFAYYRIVLGILLLLTA